MCFFVLGHDDHYAHEGPSRFENLLKSFYYSDNSLLTTLSSRSVGMSLYPVSTVLKTDIGNNPWFILSFIC